MNLAFRGTAVKPSKMVDMYLPALGKAPLAETVLPLSSKRSITVHFSFHDIDKTKLKALLEKSFGKKLGLHYFEVPAECILLAGDYVGVAVVKRINEVPYLDKIAVNPDAQGTKLGHVLWSKLKEHYPKMVWRAAKSNPANAWYARTSEQSVETEKWNIYSYGMSKAETAEISRAIDEIPPTVI